MKHNDLDGMNRVERYPGDPQAGVMAMARTERVRVPNPKKPGKGRLDARPGTAHQSKKRYRRRPKHPGRDD